MFYPEDLANEWVKLLKGMILDRKDFNFLLKLWTVFISSEMSWNTSDIAKFMSGLVSSLEIGLSVMSVPMSSKSNKCRFKMKY